MADSLFWACALSLPILPNLWCIWHASRHNFPEPGEQKRWIRAGTFAPIIGGILYLAVGMRRARPFTETEQQPSENESGAQDGN